jgi:hypothetical protein
MPDAAPVGSIVNPGEGESVEAGVAISPVVAAAPAALTMPPLSPMERPD